MDWKDPNKEKPTESDDVLLAWKNIEDVWVYSVGYFAKGRWHNDGVPLKNPPDRWAGIDDPDEWDARVAALRELTQEAEALGFYDKGRQVSRFEKAIEELEAIGPPEGPVFDLGNDSSTAVDHTVIDDEGRVIPELAKLFNKPSIFEERKTPWRTVVTDLGVRRSEPITIEGDLGYRHTAEAALPPGTKLKLDWDDWQGQKVAVHVVVERVEVVK